MLHVNGIHMTGAWGMVATDMYACNSPHKNDIPMHNRPSHGPASHSRRMAHPLVAEACSGPCSWPYTSLTPL